MAESGSSNFDPFKLTERQGTFERNDSQFRNWLSTDPDAKFAPENNRYVLYIAYPCPFAHRTSIVHTLKGLEDIIPMVVLYYELFPHGWSFTGRANTAEKDPLYGFTKLSQLYHLANPDYNGRFSVPVLWDKTHKTIVSNESADIIRMLYSSFDSFLPSELREANKATGGLLPSNLISEIDEMDDWIFRLLNVGVYKAGFATEQAVYEENCLLVFEGLDRVESVLKSSKGLYLLGDCITEPDIRLFPTIVRFDVAYHTLFKCNLKMIRYQYPKIEGWMRGLYYGEGNVGKAFGGTTCFEHIKKGYALTPRNSLVPLGPAPDIEEKS